MFYVKLKRELLSKFSSLKEASKRLDISAPYLTQILQAKKPINTNLKHKLLANGISLELFEKYEWEQAKQSREDNKLLLTISSLEDVIFHLRFSLNMQKEVITNLHKQNTNLQNEVNILKRKLATTKKSNNIPESND